MISRRQFFSILLTMLAVFMLFQGTQLGKEHWEREDPKAFSTKTGLRSDSVWTPAADGSTERNVSGVVYLGNEDSPGAADCAQWAEYAKRRLVFASSAEDKACEGAELILVPGSALAENTEALTSLMEKGTNVLCLSLPPADEIASDSKLQEMLGILSIYRKSIKLDGVHLFGGFLLGGERIYCPKDKEEAEKRQDLPLDIPWYIVRAGTETYMRGILSEKDSEAAESAEMKNEDMPAIIWRHHFGSGELFAVNGPYMSDPDIAGGIIQASLSRIETTSLYPVVDAQVFSLLDFPALSDENSGEMLPIYGREMTDISRNIILPSLVFLPNRYGVAITAFAAPQFDYNDGNDPRKGLAEQFRKEMHTLGGELALSLRSRGGEPMDKRTAADAALLADEEPPVEITSVWAEPDEIDKLSSSDFYGLSSVQTVLTLPEEGKAPLGYISDDVTVQRVTGDAAEHTYMQDISLICRETSMGYDSCYCDFSSIWQPQTDEDRWQKLADKVLSNLITYRKPFEAFEHVTASECDAKLRRYLMTDYDYSRSGDEITVRIPLLLTQTSFVLRLDDETVTEMEGGTFTQIEEGAYLLRATGSSVRIKVGPAEPLATLSE